MGGQRTRDPRLSERRDEEVPVRHGAREPEQLEPDSWTLDQHFLELPGREEAMLDLLYDDRTHVEPYPTWQRYLRDQRPPTLVVWCQNDPFFTTAGAQSVRRDQPDAEIHLFDTGHFALEERDAEIAAHIGRFLTMRLPAATAVGVRQPGW
jgi:pimeloyl-ACP methyl ester carboxylesterase